MDKSMVNYSTRLKYAYGQTLPLEAEEDISSCDEEVLPLGTKDCQNCWRRKEIAVICLNSKIQQAQ